MAWFNCNATLTNDTNDCYHINVIEFVGFISCYVTPLGSCFLAHTHTHTHTHKHACILMSCTESIFKTSAFGRHVPGLNLWPNALISWLWNRSLNIPRVGYTRLDTDSPFHHLCMTIVLEANRLVNAIKTRSSLILYQNFWLPFWRSSKLHCKKLKYE